MNQPRMQFLPAMSPCSLALGWLLAALAACLAAAGQNSAGERSTQSRSERSGTDQPSGPADYRSQHFLIHTDLAPDEAKELLQRLETMLSLISAYWQRPSSGVIECYVVEDLDRWPRDVLLPAGLKSIEQGAGVTVSQKLSSGERFVARAIVYAVSEGGTPQHEAVHAYCSQTFGRTGPVWYSEGMAEMGNYWRKGQTDVQVPQPIVDYLRSSPPKTLNGIVNNVESTGDSWQNYAWRWALCHLLENNPNYKPRFRPFGLALLTEDEDLPAARKTTFEKVYGDMADELSFEYLFFLKHVSNGYRVDLCSWDWKRKYRGLRGRTAISARIRADRGWQPAGVLLNEGAGYRYTATGNWKVSSDGASTTADGAEGEPPAESANDDAPPRLADLLVEETLKHPGRLLGIVLTEREASPGAPGSGPDDLKYQLGEPFELGASGSFTSPATGRLYVRAADAWNELSDNSGRVTVKFTLADD